MSGIQQKSFTVRYPFISNVIQSEVIIRHPLGPNETTPDISKPFFKCNAIWDTGATGTMITEKIANELGLVHHSFRNIKGINDIKTVPVYKVALELPNGVGLKSINVAQCKDLAGGFQMLIGMDIMSQGDLAISHTNGQTFFTFRMPSYGLIDFTGKAKLAPVKNSNKIGRNDPCHCGSGKKFKNCHGKAK